METTRNYLYYSPKMKFKSYYVVWKPAKARPKETESKRFKSYYVVWKLLQNPIAIGAITGLNRTM